jgi:hypothetical protein
MKPAPGFAPSKDFRPLAGFSGAHPQTLLGWALRRPRPVELHRVRWNTPDGDFLDVDLLRAPAKAPHVLVLHGLEGSSGAGYVREVLRDVASRGWGAMALNFRSCSGEQNRTLRSYNSGDIHDAVFALERLRGLGIEGPLFGVGFSLGGSVLLNLVGRTGEKAPLDAAAAISVPFDLDACARMMDAGVGLTRIYRERFLRTLRKKSLEKAAQHPGVLDEASIRAAHQIRSFDAAVTARVFGFASAEDYYAQCSSGPLLKDIRRPTLLVTSEDDPLAPARTLPHHAEQNPFLTIVRTSTGGHVGFVGGTLAHPRFWAEEQAICFFEHVLRSAQSI